MLISFHFHETVDGEKKSTILDGWQPRNSGNSVPPFSTFVWISKPSTVFRMYCWCKVVPPKLCLYPWTSSIYPPFINPRFIGLINHKLAFTNWGTTLCNRPTQGTQLRYFPLALQPSTPPFPAAFHAAAPAAELHVALLQRARRWLETGAASAATCPGRCEKRGDEQ